ncbi:hypothetical protein CWO91_22335 [Bradyrhizobium genosp. SA-3]|uniref:hypothetical protein n=1 Tax=Bradyrhizobium genosp. SA-3 TaxID=508868 RepID=UPI0010288D1A|nr:hypothetical protein [Bradyrhizobium genosp. SA-3]RZN08510.1 hypothetical protein CWO91_22335 [Bradyrhizobium genosp. SA-3]
MTDECHQYRAYLVGDDGVFRSAEAFEATSDASALTFARQFTRHGNVEVWQLGRKVAVLEPDQPPYLLTRQ